MNGILGQARMAAALAACTMIVAPPAAFAQASRKAAAQSASQWTAQPGSGPLLAVVSIGSQRVTIYDKNGPIAQAPISSGRSGFETPQGVFSIIEKKEEHYSNLYDDAPMPFMQRLTWSGVALHAGALPGYPASHGCIRLPHGFAERLFAMTKLNTRVVVVPGDVTPMSIAHPALLQPKVVELTPQEPSPPALEADPPPARRPVPLFRPEDAGAAAEMPMMLGARLARPLPPASPEPALKPQKAVVTPLEAARAERNAAAQKAVATAKAADAARLLHKAKLAETGKAHRDLAASEAARRRAEAKASQLERLVALAKTEVQAETARTQHAKAQEEAVAAVKAAAEARAGLAARQEEARSAAEAIKAADQERTAAQAAARAAERLTEPVSVLVSRKTGRVHVRQGRQPVADFAATIKDPQRPIGTHVFTVVEATNGGRNVAWSVVSVEGQGGAAPRAELDPAASASASPSRKGKAQAARGERPVPVSSEALGAAAIERVSLPEEALARITPYLQPGSSLIISDLAPSIETGLATDFVLLTRGEDQAVATARKHARDRALGVGLFAKDRAGGSLRESRERPSRTARRYTWY